MLYGRDEKIKYDFLHIFCDFKSRKWHLVEKKRLCTDILQTKHKIYYTLKAVLKMLHTFYLFCIGPNKHTVHITFQKLKPFLNSIDPDQQACEENSWSGSILFFHPHYDHILTLRPPVTTFVICFSCLLLLFGGLYCEQNEPRLDSSQREQSDQGSYCLLP